MPHPQVKQKQKKTAGIRRGTGSTLLLAFMMNCCNTFLSQSTSGAYKSDSVQYAFGMRMKLHSRLGNILLAAL